MTKEFLRMLVRLKLDSAHNHELTTFFEMYLKLTDKEEDILQEEVSHLNPDEEAKVMELINSYERKGALKGIQESICLFLKTRFGPNADPLHEHVRSINDLESLDDLLDKVFAVRSFTEAQQVIKQATK